MLRSVKPEARGQRPGASTAAILLIFAMSATAGIFPDHIGKFTKGTVKTVAIPDQPLLDEYGIDATEQAEYASGSKHFSATAWRLHDATGAMALFESRRPPGAIAVEGAKLAVQTSDGVIFAHGNYVFQLTGDVPPNEQMETIYAHLPKLDNSPLPPLMTYLPAGDLIPNSERYILGPVSLDRFGHGIPPSAAGFDLGAEAQLGTYKTAKGPLTVAIFKYPTPSFATTRRGEFQKIPGVIARRVGPLLAVAVAAPDAAEAESILAKVHYDASVTFSEAVESGELRGKVTFIFSAFVFSGFLILGCIIAGVGFGAFRGIRRKFRTGPDPEALTTLHL
jgi:hypothetical protein